MSKVPDFPAFSYELMESGGDGRIQFKSNIRLKHNEQWYSFVEVDNFFLDDYQPTTILDSTMRFLDRIYKSSFFYDSDTMERCTPDDFQGDEREYIKKIDPIFYGDE